VWVRTRSGAGWTDWERLPVEADHGPDPGSAEAARSRPGTDVVVVGEVDDVQLRVTASGRRAPDGLTLVVVDPGDDDTATVPGSPAASRLGSPRYPATAGDGSATPRPGIYSRAQWGADESLRDGFTGYGEITGSFVHHTVNANAYTAAEVPSILRAIYAYHTQGRGWSDIGYNFLVDRFGRVWEGRWGGIARPVIGAHTLGYNEEAFAMSAIGNFDVAQPTAAMLGAYGRLYAWKLSRHGVAADASVRIDGDTFPAVNGHRDAAATACPGRYLYAKLPQIRQAAAKAQAAWSARGLRRSIVGGPRPDLLVRDGDRMSVLAGDPTGLRPAGRLDGRWARYSWVRIVGDWDGDGVRDVMGREDGRLWLLRGLGDGRFAPRAGGWGGWDQRTLLTPLGDWDGDGRADLAARVPGGAVWLFPGRGTSGTGTGYQLRSSVGEPGKMFGVGRWDDDGAPDLMTRGGDGRLWLWPGNGPGGLLEPRLVATGMDSYDLLIGAGDLDRDGAPDLVGRDKTTERLYLLPGTAGGGIGSRVAISSNPVAGDLLG
ncbi:MAG: N-acetylmuramoyl-L-alanine amidase, partial [Nocardioidaceae bacterium]|nr:N-acetylmuramoyl-L-alanine amidase [Nocardioidaceae bacterium]